MYEVGEPVRVRTGDWAGCEGRIDQIDGDQLLLTILVTSQQVPVPAGDVAYDPWFSKP